MRHFSPVTCVIILWVLVSIYMPSRIRAQKETCSLRISITLRDSLGNVDAGLTDDDTKWLEKILRKHYQETCYEKDASKGEYAFLISVSNQEGEVTPILVNFPVYTLKVIHTPLSNNPSLLRTFQRYKPAEHNQATVHGVIASVGNPERDVILDALDWLVNSELNETPYQSHKN